MHPWITIPAGTLTEATNIINEQNIVFASRPLVGAIIESGGLPVALLGVTTSLAPPYFDFFDEIIFAGGSDVDPTFFNKEPH